MLKSHAAKLFPGVALLLTLIACGDGALLGPDAPQGIDGIVMLGPQCPVQTLNDPCPDVPYAAWINVRLPGGKLVERVRSGTDGRFRVGLEPGTYIVDPESGSPFPVASPMDVQVDPGVYSEVTVDFDTGIR